MESVLIHACNVSVFQRCSNHVPAFPERKRQVGYIVLLYYSEIPLRVEGPSVIGSAQMLDMP